MLLQYFAQLSIHTIYSHGSERGDSAIDRTNISAESLTVLSLLPDSVEPCGGRLPFLVLNVVFDVVVVMLVVSEVLRN